MSRPLAAPTPSPRSLGSVGSCGTCYLVRPRGPVTGPQKHEGLGVSGPHTLAPRPKRAQRAGPEPRALLSSAKPSALCQPGGGGSDAASSALEGVSRQQNASTVRRWRLCSSGEEPKRKEECFRANNHCALRARRRTRIASVRSSVILYSLLLSSSYSFLR